MRKLFSVLWLIVAAPAAAALAADIPPAVSRSVDFEKDVAPIFQASCMQCHANGKYEADLSIESRDKMLEGGATSPAIVVGKSADSLLVQLVSGADPERIMPRKGKRLTPEQIGVLRAWIDQGAAWPKGFVLHDANKPIPARLEPREVPVPPATAELINPIDRLLQPYFESHKITPGKVVDDRVFARRIYLDVVGLLPPADDLEKFVADTNPQKRADLVHKLLADNDKYATHWLSFWNDLLRNDYKGTGYIDGGRLQITRWLYESLKKDKPYDQFVRELVVGVPGAEGFTKGIVWRGVVNSAQTPQMQAAQNIGQVFMGVNLKCASCHDSFISQWKLTDSYGLAGVYADKPLEMVRCAKPLGKTAPMKFLYPELGTIDQSAPKTQRIEQLAKIVTSERNGRLSRTIVNRLWQRLMGRAIIEPVDEMDNPPWNTDLLDALAWDFAHDGKYDLKRTIETIVLSRAYQLPAVPLADENAKEYVFAGPGIKRMTAEQFVDAVSTVSGVWSGKVEAKLTDSAERYAKAKWIWNDREASKAAAPGKLYFRKTFDLKNAPGGKATALVAADNTFELFVNGKSVAKGEDAFNKPVAIDVLPYLVAGKNVVAAIAENTSDKPNPAGFWLSLEMNGAAKGGKRAEIYSNTTWKMATTRPAATQPAANEASDWTSVAFDDSAWPKAVYVADVTGAPWNLAAGLPNEAEIDRSRESRAALCAATPLTTALGRPNRDVVNTVRPSAATTLIALELTNGGTLTDMLAQGAKKMATSKDVNADELVNQIFQRAMGRSPTAQEAAIAKETIRPNVKEDGVEDLLWAVVMLPEFQLIR